MTLTFELDLEGRDEPPCQISTSAIISFLKLLADTQTDSHTHPPSALPGPVKWSTEIDLSQSVEGFVEQVSNEANGK